MDEGSAEPSLAEIHQEMSELLDKQVNAQKDKIFRGSRKLLQKCAMKMKVELELEKKRRARKSIIHRRKPFITPKQKTSEDDLHELLGNDCGYNEGTICVVDGVISFKRMVFRAWAHERASLNSQWLVLRISGADFLHCWVADSIWLERVDSLITKR